jgi:hypothetical protein
MMAALALAGALAASQAWAADTLPPGRAQGSQRPAHKHTPLASGRSAGVRQAQQARTGIALAGAAGVMAVVVLAVTSGGGGGNDGQATPQMQNNSVTTTATTS